MCGLSARLQYASIFLTVSFRAWGTASTILKDIHKDTNMTIIIECTSHPRRYCAIYHTGLSMGYCCVFIRPNYKESTSWRQSASKKTSFAFHFDWDTPRAREAFSRDHVNRQLCHWHTVLFTEEGRFHNSTCDRRVLSSLKHREERYNDGYIIQYDRYALNAVPSYVSLMESHRLQYDIGAAVFTR